MAYSQKAWERARIACGVNPLDPERPAEPRERALKAWERRWGVDPRPREQATKAWNQRWDRAPSTRASNGWYKSVTGGPVQLATKSYGGSVPRVPAFDWRYVTDHNPGNATKSFGGVSLKSDGGHLYAAEERVISVRDAGMSPFLAPLVKLTTVSGKSFIVERAALQPPEW